MESILDLDAAFIEATESVKDFVNIDASNMLRLYGFYKQATQGECNIPKPSMFSYSALKKYLAWKAVGSISQEEAKSNYIEIVNSLVKASPGTSDNRKVNTQFGVAVSSMLKTEKQLDDCDKTIFDFLKEGNCSRVSILLQSEPVLLDQMDESEMQLIHWAADRGDHEMIQLLVNKGANVNAIDGIGQTPLHFAYSCGHIECIKLLKALGADETICDHEGKRPTDLEDS